MRLFKSDPDADAGGYYSAVAAGVVMPNEITIVKLKGERIIITRLNGSLFAFSAFCPHAAGDLSKGEIYKGRIDCPDHGYKFDVRSGYPVWPEDEVCRLKRFSVKEEDGQIKIKFD